MAHQIDLNELEREVEQARARFAGDLARLRDPKTIAAAKDELRAQAGDYKDEALNRARQAATTTVQGLLEQARLRIERNPTAAVAIGAGLAWKLVRDPPIGGLLIAAGLAGLVVVRPNESGSQTPTTDAILAARDAALERARRTSISAQDAGRQIGDHIREGATAARTHASALATQTTAQIVDGAASASAQAADAAARAGDYVERTRDFARRQFKENPLYFGVAALVLGAALSLATRGRGASDPD